MTLTKEAIAEALGTDPATLAKAIEIATHEKAVEAARNSPKRAVDGGPPSHARNKIKKLKTMTVKVIETEAEALINVEDFDEDLHEKIKPVRARLTLDEEDDDDTEEDEGGK